MSRKKRSKAGSAFVRISADGFSKIKRMWAENGIVRMEQVDGKVINLPWVHAALRAEQLNKGTPAMKEAGVADSIIKEHLRLIERTAEVCREAKAQIANPDKKTAKLQNIISGCDANGKPLVDGLPQDYWIERFSLRYHTIKRDEVISIVRQVPGGNMKRAEEIIRGVHRQRMAKDSPAPVGV